MDEKEKIRFIDEKRLTRVLDVTRDDVRSDYDASADKAGRAGNKASARTFCAATNPVKSAFLKFVNSKYKFEPKDF